MEGSGKMLVVAVGLYSQSGIIFALLTQSKKERKNAKKEQEEGTDVSNRESDEEDQSVLQKKLTKIATNIGKVGT